MERIFTLRFKELHFKLLLEIGNYMDKIYVEMKGQNIYIDLIKLFQ